MSISFKNEIQKHHDNLPDNRAEEVLQYLRFLELNMRESQIDNSSLLLSEASLAKEWVIADWGGDDVILAQITRVSHKDEFAISSHENDFTNGSLKNTISFIRPNKFLTTGKTTAANCWKFKESKTGDMNETLVDMIRNH